MLVSLLSSSAVATSSASVPQGPGPGPIPMSQFGTISRQISRHNSSTTSSASMVSATGTYRRAPSVSSQQPHINGGLAYTQNSGLIHLFISHIHVNKVVASNSMKLAFLATLRFVQSSLEASVVSIYCHLVLHNYVKMLKKRP